MHTSESLSSAQLRSLNTQLVAIRSRLLDQFESQVESLREELNPQGELSNAPLHIGDAAPTQLDVNVNLLENDHEMLQMVHEALQRIESHKFGLCRACGKPIPFERLEQDPLRQILCAVYREEGTSRQGSAGARC